MKTAYFSDKHIPAEMKMFPQWVLWRYVYRNRKEKPTKIPINPKTGKAASVNDSRTWGKFSQAIQALSEYVCDGMGFVFTENDPFIGVDFDGCVSDSFWMDTVPEIEELTKICASYTELSPSQTGIHIILKGSLPDGVKGYNNRNGIEMYSSGRFFCITALPEYLPHRQIIENQTAIDAIYAYAKATALQVKALPIKKNTPSKPSGYKLNDLLNYPFPEGSRNTSLFQLGCAYRTHGASDKAICQTLDTANRIRCKPPLSDDDVERIVRSVCRYERGCRK